MPTFRYLALNTEHRAVRGDVQADTVAQAITRLEAESLTVQSIWDVAVESEARAAGQESPVSGGPSAASESAEAAGLRVERAALESQMTTVLASGQELLPALRAYLAELPAGRQRREWAKVLRALEQGDVAGAIQDLTALPEYWIPLLAAAAATHDPSRVLRDFLDQSRRAVEMQRQWWRTFAYPLAVVVLAFAVLAVINVLIVPPFRRMFEEFALKLPALTAALISLSDWIVSGRILIAAAVALLATLLVVCGAWLLPGSWRGWLADRCSTPLGRASAMARLATFTADLLEAGLPVPSALRVAGFATRSRRLRRGAWRLATQLDVDGRPTQPGAFRPLPRTFLHALQAELATGSRIQLLRAVSTCHADQAEAWWSWTRGAVEPLAVCVVGGMVGLTFVALFLPLISLVQGLSS